MYFLKSLARRTPQGAPLIFSIGLFSKEEDKAGSNFDIVDREKELQEIKLKYEQRSDISWTERLSLMWRIDEYGALSPELNQCIFSTYISAVCGGIVGSYVETQRIMKVFLERNKYEMFKHPREAQAAVRDKWILTAYKGFFRYGSRMAILTGTYMCVSQSLTAIRNYVNPLDHAVGGMMMGAVYRFNMGPKGMLAAGVLGGIIGLQAGCIWWVIQWATGETVEERWRREYFQYRLNVELKEATQKLEDERQKLIEEGGQAKSEPYVEEEDSLDFVHGYILLARKWLVDAGILSSPITLKEDNGAIVTNPKL